MQALTARLGNRRTRALLAVAAVLLLLILLAFAAIVLVDAVQAGHRIRALLWGLLTLLAVVLWLRLVWVQRALLRARPALSTPDPDDSGIWGIGGPNVRIPGATGIFRMRESRGRRAEDTSEPR